MPQDVQVCVKQGARFFLAAREGSLPPGSRRGSRVGNLLRSPPAEIVFIIEDLFLGIHGSSLVAFSDVEVGTAPLEKWAECFKASGWTLPFGIEVLTSAMSSRRRKASGRSIDPKTTTGRTAP
jgi:hypothetical protein